jgi:leader peptidase (prepilin peptidase)/N-methyltransferase
MIAVAALWLFAGHQVFQFWGPIAGVALFLLFGGLYAISRGKWLGFGDVKLAFLIGLLFGRGAVGVTLVAIWGGALIGLALMALGRANRQTALPFGSFWTAAAIAAILWPDMLYGLSRFFLSYGFQ